MCGSNPELSPEVNSAKCIGGTALGFAIVTLIGLAIVPWGTVSAFAGIFGTIAGGIVCCCGPKTKREADERDDGEAERRAADALGGVHLGREFGVGAAHGSESGSARGGRWRRR